MKLELFANIYVSVIKIFAESLKFLLTFQLNM